MKYCVNCGAHLNDYADFCTKCGTRINYSAGTQRDVRFAGSVIKCACCGEILNSGDIKCPKCKYEIRNGNVSKAVGDFFREYRRISEQRTNRQSSNSEADIIDRQLADHIKGFAIPNTKEDIFEFFDQAYSHLDIGVIYDDSKTVGSGMTEKEYKGQRLISQAWEEKLNYSYQKAESYCSNDKRIADIRQKFQDYRNKKEQAKKRASIKKTGPMLVKAFPVIGVTAVIIIASAGIGSHLWQKHKENERLSEVASDIEDYIYHKNYDKAEIKLKELEKNEEWNSEADKLNTELSKKKLDDYFSEVDTLVDKGDYGQALEMLENIDPSLISDSDDQDKLNNYILKTDEKKRISDGTDVIKMPKAAKKYKGENYKDVMKQLEALGFINIELEEEKDLKIGLLKEDGEVESISINGETKFKKDKEFNYQDPVTIVYHTFK